MTPELGHLGNLKRLVLMNVNGLTTLPTELEKLGYS